jgi:Fe-S-cluster containining protein
MSEGGGGTSGGGGNQSDRDVERGLMLAHNNATDQLEQIHRLSAHVYALTQLLVRDEVVKLAELEALRQATHDEMRERNPLRWLVARVHDVEGDKYDPARQVSIDCASRLPLCRAACCRLDFYLGNQDLEEGAVRWDLARPYHIKQREDGYCVHCSAEGSCEVWARRPATCRTYDCRGDARIWVDFEARIPNPALAAPAPAPTPAPAEEPASPSTERPLPSLRLGRSPTSPG